MTWAWLDSRSSVQYRTTTVEHGDINVTISATGNPNAVVTVQVGSQVSGNILALFADFNTEIVDRAVGAAQESLDISTIQYRGGLASYLQVITAQTSLLQSQRTTVDILTRRLVASVSLIQALGGGWDASQLPSPSELR
jgi:hypothetical protein